MALTLTHEEAARFLPAGALWIGGAARRESTGGSVPHVDPATGKPLGSIVLAGRAEVAEAVATARAAAVEWQETPGRIRRRILHRLADLVEKRDEEFGIITALETGKPFAPGATTKTVEYIRYYAGWADKLEGRVVPVDGGLDYVLSEPFGVVAAIFPWNATLPPMALKVAPALAAGNCVVLKPAPEAPFVALRFTELAEEAGLPAGVLGVIPGGADTGQALVAHPDVDKITFTGRLATAREVMRAASDAVTPLVLELGGKAANIVFADADLAKTAVFAARLGIAHYSGQGCVVPTRLLVERSVYDQVVPLVVETAKSFVVGDPLAAGVDMGPVISEAACDRILEVIDTAVAQGQGELLCGGHRLGGELADGFFLEATVFGEVDNGSPLAQEEIFGPVLSIIPFDDEADALRIANDSRYGLAGFVHTRDVARAHRVASKLEAGFVSINGVAPMPPGAPFGGMKDSGFGREGGRAGIDEFLRIKNVHVPFS